MLNSLVGIIASSGGAVAGGAYESIASVTGTGSSDTITFSSIPSGYTSLQLRFNAIGVGGGSLYRLRFNGDTGTNYAYHYLNGSGASVSAAGAATTVSMLIAAGGASGTYPTVGVLDFHNYASTTQYKTARMITGCDTNSATGWVELESGLWMNTAAITSITILQLSSYSFSTTSTFALYGIKGA